MHCLGIWVTSVVSLGRDAPWAEDCLSVPLPSCTETLTGSLITRPDCPPVLCSNRVLLVRHYLLASHPTSPHSALSSFLCSYLHYSTPLDSLVLLLLLLLYCFCSILDVDSLTINPPPQFSLYPPFSPLPLHLSYFYPETVPPLIFPIHPTNSVHTIHPSNSSPSHSSYPTPTTSTPPPPPPWQTRTTASYERKT